MSERRTSERRRLAFVRSAVLDVEGRGHLVTVADLSPEGAFLTTRAPVDDGEPRRLRFVVPGSSRPLELACRLVWRGERFEAETGRPAGLAVRFVDLTPEARAKIEEFCQLAATKGRGRRQFEYQVLERLELDVEELDELGRDGWELASALPARDGVKIVLLRRR